MPLSPAPPRQSVHDRQVRCQGYRRADGLWDIEGHLTDTKSYDFTNQHRGEVRAGEAVHEMWLRLTIDDDFVIRAVEAVADFAPYRVCPAITPNFQRLVGVKIAPGFRRQVARHLAACKVAPTRSSFWGHWRRRRSRQSGPTGGTRRRAPLAPKVPDS